MPNILKALQGASGNAGEALYVEDVFSTYLYTGNGSTQSITNGIDLSGEGGLVWVKRRDGAGDHQLFDTERGAGYRLRSNSTLVESYNINTLSSFNSDGFSVGAVDINDSGHSLSSWTFRKAEKFFDVVTYTGDGTAGRQISHNLGSTPGFFVVKRTDSADSWKCWHTSTGDGVTLELDGIGADTGENWPTGGFTSTYFTVNSGGSYNASGGTYVAYLFASDAGGFGDDDESIIKCGSYTGNGSTDGPTVTLGFEPQWLMIRGTGGGDWQILDNMRGIHSGGTNDARLLANSSAAEYNSLEAVQLQATGFKIDGTTGGAFNGSGSTYIYIAIRRPMKTPESGTEVFAMNTGTSNGFISGFPVDTAFFTNPSTTFGNYFFDRLRGEKYLESSSTAAEGTDPFGTFDSNTSWYGTVGSQYLSWMFKRATGFFDVVAYTGTGSNTTQAHNLGVAPELMIVKRRNLSRVWAVWASGIDIDDYLTLNGSAGVATFSLWQSTLPTATEITLGTDASVNGSSDTYVAYLFATLAGVSKVGSYTGNGTSQTIDCGFSGGARFILIKSTSTTGSWWVYDSARGIVAGNDPALQLNSTAAEVTSADAIDPDSSGFIVNQEATCSINASGVSYIFMSIA